MITSGATLQCVRTRAHCQREGQSSGVPVGRPDIRAALVGRRTHLRGHAKVGCAVCEHRGWNEAGGRRETRGCHVLSFTSPLSVRRMFAAFMSWRRSQCTLEGAKRCGVRDGSRHCRAHMRDQRPRPSRSRQSAALGGPFPSLRSDQQHSDRCTGRRRAVHECTVPEYRSLADPPAQSSIAIWQGVCQRTERERKSRVKMDRKLDVSSRQRRRR